MNKRIIALVLGLICLMATVLGLVSCADGKKNDTTSSGDTSAGIEHLEGLNFEDTEVTFIVASADGDSYHQRSISVEIDDGELDDSNAVDAEIYKRNKKIESDLGVQIVLADYADRSISEHFKGLLLSGDDSYDVIGARQYDDIQLALDGVVLDINKLGDFNADYIKWQNEYWGSTYIDALSFGDKVYWLAGDLCLRYIGGYYAFFVNSNLYKELLEDKYGSIYSVVRNNQWTYDTLIEMLPLGYKDINANDRVDNQQDQLGIALPVWDNANGWSISAGVVYTGYDAEGMPYCTINSSYTLLLDFMKKCNEMIQTKGVYKYGGDYRGAMKYFEQDKAVFVAGRLNQAELYLSEMETDYYVIPCPKLTPDQEFRTAVHDAINIYGICKNISSEQVRAAAATLEEMAYLSYHNVRPVYFDSVLKYKYTRDADAAEMIDIMHDGVYTDFVFIWQFSDRFGDAQKANKLGDYLRNAVLIKNSSVTLKKQQTRWADAVKKIVDEIKELDED